MINERRLHLSALLAVAFALAGASAAGAAPPYPKVFNFYGRNYFEPTDIPNLAKYDILSLDVDSPDSILVQIKAVNPNIKILAYIPINGTWANATVFPSNSKWREMFEVIDANNWWLWNTQGGHVSDHIGKWTANTTSLCPVNAQGETYLDWFPRFITQSVLQNGASNWDGVFLDNVWIGIWFINANTGLNPYPIDADRDGTADPQPTLDMFWRAGNDTLIKRLARTFPPGELLTGNGQNYFYEQNGTMIETFPFKGTPELGHPLGYTWVSKMFGGNGYFVNEDSYQGVPRVNIINTKWPYGDRFNPDRTPEYGRRKRFVMGSTMLRDGYVSIDIGLENGGAHFSIWWEPEFDKPIGTPLGPPYQGVFNGTTLWRRDYSNGSVIVNDNWTTFLGSKNDYIPPISYCDALILLNNEFWDPNDNDFPAPISDLTVTRTWENQIELQWTNVGDNYLDGQAFQVEVRYNSTLMNGPKYYTSTILPQNIVPFLPGLPQTVIVPNLTRNQQYHFAAKTRDLRGHWGAISNVVSAVTLPGDTTAPAPVTDLQILSTTPTRATVRWTATGDDGNTGTASFFDLRYALFPIDTGNMNSAASVVGEPTPGPPGTVHTMNLTGMMPNRTYYFMIRVGDEMPNWSPLSNIPFATTLPGDSIPPAAITDLRVVGVETNAITLAWTCPGDDGMVGRANLYDLRLATFPIHAGNWDGTNYIVGEPGPLDPGQTQTFRVAGLGFGYLYYFAMKTADEWPNWSPISNTTWASTGPVSGVGLDPPARLELRPGRPNPTTDATSIAFELPGETRVTIEVHDVRGRRVAVLVDEPRPLGRYEVTWDGRDESGAEVPSGVYFIRMNADGESRRQKVMITR